MIMKKNYYLLLFLVLISVPGVGQTNFQKGLIKLFFESYDAQESIGMMHPSCKFRGATVTEIANNSIYISAVFVDNGFFGSGTPFICKYKISIDNDGVFRNLVMLRCGNIEDDDGIVECGAAVTISKIIEQESGGELFESAHSAIEMQEELKGKRLSQFRGREIVCAVLFAQWYDDGYYFRY